MWLSVYKMVPFADASGRSPSPQAERFLDFDPVGPDEPQAAEPPAYAAYPAVPVVGVREAPSDHVMPAQRTAAARLG